MIYKTKATYIQSVGPTPANPYGRKVTHPTLWVWVDDEGYERVYQTKREAQEAKTAWEESNNA